MYIGNMNSEPHKIIIDYYYDYGLSYNAPRIVRDFISTDNPNYIKHDDKTVTFKDIYIDMYDEERPCEVTRSRDFEYVKNKSKEHILKRIERNQEYLKKLELITLENFQTR